MKKLPILLFILLSLIPLALATASDHEFNMTIYYNDNSTGLDLYNWSCTLTNISSDYSISRTAIYGCLNDTINHSTYDVSCTYGATSDKQYFFNITNVNITTDLNLNVTITQFNLSKDATSSSYPINTDITFDLNLTQSDRANISSIMVKSYLTSGLLNSGCVTQTNTYDFNQSDTITTSTTLDLSGCSWGSYYLDTGVFDADLLYYIGNNTESGNSFLYIYRRQAVTITDSTTAVITHDLLEGLPQVGTDTGDFLGNLAPGLGKFIIVLAVFVGIAGIIGAIIYLVRKKVQLK